MIRPTTLRCLASLVVVTLLGLSMTSCLLQILLGRVVVSASEEEVVLQAQLQASANVAVCVPTEPSGFECTYVIDGEILTSTAELASDGLPGLFYDPVILQAPAEAFAFSGTFGGMGTSGNLNIQSGLASVPVDLDSTLFAEPGMQLVVVDFPQPAPPIPSSYGFLFDFQLPLGFGPVMVKAIFTGRVEVGGEVFYPPLFPCVDNFVEVPEILIPESDVFQALDLSAAAELPTCDGTLYSYGSLAAVDVPVASPLGLGLLAALIAAAALFVFAKRR